MHGASGTQSLALKDSRNSFAALQRIAENLFPSKWLWLATFALAMVDAAGILVSQRYGVSSETLIAATEILALVPVLAWRLSWKTRPASPGVTRVAQLAMLTIYFLLSAVVLGMFQYVANFAPHPMQTGTLMRWDEILGFNWPEYGRAVAQHPHLSALLGFVYMSMPSEIFLVAFLALIGGNSSRPNEVFFLTLLSSLVIIMIGVFFPAQSAMDVLGTNALKSQFPPNVGSTLQEILRVQSGVPITLDARKMTSLITFPSFHTAAAVIIIYCSRGWLLSASIGAFFGVVMLLSTPIYGGHYLIDIIAGAAITLALIIFTRMLRPETAAKFGL